MTLWEFASGCVSHGLGFSGFQSSGHPTARPGRPWEAASACHCLLGRTRRVCCPSGLPSSCLSPQGRPEGLGRARRAAHASPPASPPAGEQEMKGLLFPPGSQQDPAPAHRCQGMELPPHSDAFSVRIGMSPGDQDPSARRGHVSRETEQCDQPVLQPSRMWRKRALLPI